MITRINNKYFKNSVKINDSRKIKILDEKFKQLKIPPGYIRVDINPTSKSIIAKCIDSAKRKQYIYHPDFINKQKKLKYCNLITFGNKLSTIRRQLNNDIKSNDQKQALIATVLKVILECNFRIGNEKYQKMYNSVGISTIGNKHLNGRHIKFIGKKGVVNNCTLTDTNLVKILNNLKHKKSKHIFSHQGSRITAEHVNNYLQQFGNFTTKYFRTWAANIEFIKTVNNKVLDKKGIKNAINQVAIKLNHTPAVCKKSYIYSDLIINAQCGRIKTNNPQQYFISYMKTQCS